MYDIIEEYIYIRIYDDRLKETARMAVTRRQYTSSSR